MHPIGQIGLINSFLFSHTFILMSQEHNLETPFHKLLSFSTILTDLVKRIHGPCKIELVLFRIIAAQSYIHSIPGPFVSFLRMMKHIQNVLSQGIKNIIKLEHYYSPKELETQIAAFVDHYNNQRYHESLDNVTPADVYYGRKEEILKKRTN